MKLLKCKIDYETVVLVGNSEDNLNVLSTWLGDIIVEMKRQGKFVFTEIKSEEQIPDGYKNVLPYGNQEKEISVIEWLNEIHKGE